ncbi:hypothetical protein ACIPV2_04690 [Microbacterium sp. NPDC089987]|uniref:hypothetical protein n=1 Tax=Microbacterium sp. NPDC089987 TaxID=3364202 RepID=UPI0037FCA91C
MNSDPEDDALSWEGDDALEARRPGPRREQAPDVAHERSATQRPADGEVVAGIVPGTADPARDTDIDDEPQGIGTATLVLLGIFGGVYLLYTIGWAIGGVGMQAKAMFMLPAPLYLASMWIAVLAPALWFTATLMLTRGGRDWVRISALVVGAALLVPWPFVVAGGGGAL